MPELFKNITTWLATSRIKVLGILIALLVLSPMSKSGMVEAVSLRRLVKKSLSAGCSKMPRYKAPEILRSEAYQVVRRNDEGSGQRRRWAFFSSLLEEN